ncbi:hypothetical protein EV667_3805 [Ancylobacter aquaticus]|uniref:Uncharacterized protein n=1 Tax=Ancylobacter aquaticus TaxID=100 RepID=A0A4R1HTD1_ANCAQ|nr:hypothetical protein [Ancylobacter aquaticus]TCK23129.1 hypothetical protein EV667_3805 [Ancylobacter aquaticus]
MSVAPVRLHDHAHGSAPSEGRGTTGAGGHGHAHSADHDHGHGHPAGASRHRRHSHAAGERHPPARPGFSLLRLSALQRLAIALPLAAALWVLALAVIGVGA